MKKRLLYLLACCTGIPGLFAQNNATPTPQWRPSYHFTPEKNWTNDPNGLIYLNGVYHLYNQQNPYENKWGHMSWGHATSKDLVHWDHLPLAIPEKIGSGGDTTLIFSGCAVWDKDNTSGFCKTGGCMVIIYTADQPRLQKESQFVAYSNDNGMTFTDYDKNPVIDLQKKDFRDPNVSWNSIMKKWLMVVAVPNEHKVRFYSSPNLKTWDLLSEFGPAGYVSAPWECPFFLHLPVEGKPGQWKWVLALSAAGAEKGVYMEYFVGDFDGTNFKSDNGTETAFAVDDGDAMYAAIPWNNTPGKNTTYIGWLVPGTQETFPWKGQMSIPRDLSLKVTSEGIRLFQRPSDVAIDALVKRAGTRITTKEGLTVKETLSFDEPVRKMGNAYAVEATITPGTSKDFGFSIGKKDQGGKTVQETVIGYHVNDNQLYVDRSNSGKATIAADKRVRSIDIKPVNGKIKLLLLVDKSSLEVFVNDGEKVISAMIYPDNDATGFSVFAKDGSITLNKLIIRDLSENAKK